MKKCWLGYLGFLGLLGLLGYFTGNFGFYGFFGFFGWFSFFKIIPDERFAENLNKACRNAFFVTLVWSAIIIVAGAITQNAGVYIAGFVINFALAVIVFALSLPYYDRTEKEDNDG